MKTGRIVLDREYAIGEAGPRLFGSFLEHLGRAIYGGIYEPAHPRADENGFRRDVLDLVRDLRVPVIRYPGGNFVSSFKWEDSVGPVQARPRRLDLAWRSVEPNEFGLSEFMRWARLAQAEPMIAINLGTRGIEDAVNLVEYCNHPSGSYWSDLRRSHGDADPFGVKLWCLGNEMDGPWQVGQKTASEYGRVAFETAKAIKLFDPSIELVACGSSFPDMPTFPAWEETVLDFCYDKVDYLSLHQYQQNKGDDLPTYLGASLGMDRFIETVVSACDIVQAKKRSKKRVNLSFDEWNVWFHSLEADGKNPPWAVGPRLLEDVYTLEDALVAGCLLNSLIRHADRVKIACLAQLVNVIAPIMTENGGGAWKQTIYWPFYYASRFGRGTVLDARSVVPSYDNPTWGAVPLVDSTAVLDTETGRISLFLVNRSPDESVAIDVDLRGFGDYRLASHVEVSGPDPKATNTAVNPNAVCPIERPTGDGTTIRLSPLSWGMATLLPVPR